MASESVWALLTDLAHWELELVSEVAFFVVEVVILDRLFHWHRTHHKR